MTAYALYGLAEAKRAGYRIEEYRLQNGARALAAMYAEYPRAEPDLKAYVAYVMRRALPDRDEVNYRGGQDDQRTYSHDAARNELWDARERMSAYGRALLLLMLDEAKDARGNELARDADRRSAERRRAVLVGARSRSAALRLRRHQRRSHGDRGARARPPRSGQSAARSRRALADAESPRRLLVDDQADRDGALRAARSPAGAQRDRRSRSASMSIVNGTIGRHADVHRGLAHGAAIRSS